MKNTKNKGLEEIIYVSWEESERGWGTRPDGCSLHLDEQDYRVFLKEYWDRQPDEVPDEYSRPAGRPVNAYASSGLYQKISESKDGLRFWKFQESDLVANKEWVYSNERSGWMNVER